MKYSTSDYASLSYAGPTRTDLYADVRPFILTTVKMPSTTDSNVQYSLLTHDQHKDPAGMITLDQYSDTTTLASLVTNTYAD